MEQDKNFAIGEQNRDGKKTAYECDIYKDNKMYIFVKICSAIVDTLQQESIIEKLKSGMKFGLFEDGKKCYFQDGVCVSYTELWKALRIIHEIDEGKKTMTLSQLCPDTFVGVFEYKFSKHRWEKMQKMK